MTPAPISVDRYTVTGDIAYPIHEDTNGEYVRHSDYAALLQQLADWDRLLQAVVLSGVPKDLPVEVPSLWPFNGGQDAAMVAFALHTARERAEAAERAREEATELLREVHRNGWGQLTISDLGKAPLLERIAAYLAANDSRGQMGGRGT